MTVAEIFISITKKMVEGLMFHSQLSDFFCFLGLKGYAQCQKYHYFEESCNYKKFGEYYLTHYNKIVAEDRFSNPNVIPKDWGKYTRADVDPSTRKTNIQVGFEKWVSWETEVKQEYEKLYKELINLNEVAAATELQKYITEVDEELASATQKWLELKAMDWNICDIIDEQDHYYKKYSKKIKSLTY